MKNILRKILIRGILSYKYLFRGFRGLLFDDRILDKLLADVRVLDVIFLTPHTFERIFTDIRILERILLDGRTLEKVLSDTRILNKILLGERTIEKILTDARIMGKNQFYNRLIAAIEFQQAWQAISHLIQPHRADITQKYHAALTKVQQRDRGDMKNLLLDVICEGNKIFLTNGVMKFPDLRSLWILIQEILIDEDYYFETTVDAPRILDCGTHFGLAIYYFKSLYPNARITGFEPVPMLREFALENVRENDYKDVEILPYALSDKHENATFFTTDIDSMAGSLTQRRRVAGDEVREIEVECHRLSEFLQEQVHFLKLDIEGVEDIVLFEAEAYLDNVQHIFCEYHHANGLSTERLGKILLLLDRAGFDIHINEAFYLHNAMQQPMKFLDRPYSSSIWAKNRNWNPDCGKTP